MSLFLDSVVVGIAALCIFLAVKRGFIKSALEFVFHLGGLFVAFALASPVSRFISLHFISPALEKSVTASLERIVGESVESASQLPLDQLLVEMPESIRKLLERFGASAADLLKAIIEAPSVEEGRQKAVQAIVAPMANTISYVLAFILCLVVVIIAARLLIVLVDALFHLPILNGLNKSLGFVAGIVNALLFVILFVNIVRIALPFAQNFDLMPITQDTIDQTVLFSWFYRIDLVDYFRF